MTAIRRILFEYPEYWLEDLEDPISRMHADCLRAFRRVSSRFGLDVEVKTSLGLADFAPRVTDESTLLVSMHTVGVYPNVARLKEAYLPNYYYLDRSGFSGWAEIAFNEALQDHAVSLYPPAAAEAYVSNLRAELLARNSSKYPQNSEDISTELDQWGEFVFLPLQIVDDVVAHLSDVGQPELLQAVAEAGRNLNKSVVVKLHPMSKKDGMLERVHELQRRYPNLYLTQGSVLKIARRANVVVTVNSGVGFESLILGTPVLSVGKSDFSFVTAAVSRVDEVASALSDLSVDWNKIHCFINFFVEDYTFSITSDASLERLLGKWLDEDHRAMRNLHGVEFLTRFFQDYHQRVRKQLERPDSQA